MSLIGTTGALTAVRNLLSTKTNIFNLVGLQPPQTLLLCGPPGVGKTKAVEIAAKENDLPIYSISPGSNVQAHIKDVFRNASHSGQHHHGLSCIIFIDEIDVICPATPTHTPNAPPTPATGILVALIDSLSTFHHSSNTNQVFIIAATNRAHAVHVSLRRAGRFDNEVKLSPPSSDVRFQLLLAMVPDIDSNLGRELADGATGFVAADLHAACAKATKEGNSSQSFRNAFHVTKPSILRQNIVAEIPNCSWDDIGGLDQIKRRLQMAVTWPLLYRETYKRLQLKSPRGILLYGPPGCSKTTLVRAAASASHAAFISVSGADIYSSYLGEAERIVREAFMTARAAAPCILFLDEIEAIVGKRSVSGKQSDGNGVQERILSTFLTEMDGIESAGELLVIGATNRVEMLDDALLRPGRFDDILHVDLPDKTARLEILKIHTRDMLLDEDVDLVELSKRTTGYSGADLKGICNEAGLAAVREIFNDISSETKIEGVKANISVGYRHFSV